MTLPFSDVLIAGTSHIRESFFDEVKCFDPSAIKPYSPGYLAGWSAQAYDVFLPEAWTTAKEHLRERSKEACWRSTGGDRVRQFTGRFQFNDEIWHYDLHPFFVASYQFGRKTYQVLISGHSGHIVGHQPVAWWKVYTLVALFQLPAILLFLLTLIALLFPPALIILFVFWVVFLFLGIVGSILLVRWAYAKENA